MLPDENKLKELLALLGSKVFENVSSHYILNFSNYVLRTWSTMIMSSNAKDGWKKRYSNSLRIDFKNRFNYEISTNDMFAGFVENGIKRWDMKNPPNGGGLLNGSRTKHNKKGEPYNIVMFQKGTPLSQGLDAMPGVVYESAKKLSYGSSLKNIVNASSSGGEKGKNTNNKKSNYSGLTKLGQSGHTSYGSFRVITKKSLGWIYPSIAPTPIYSRVVEVVSKKQKEIFFQSMTDVGLQSLAK
jgi:hypothetical protein